ncbi:unknown [Feldmannia species virus]|uniref:Uncharacterized protein n=1 Tax=Feldmannia species virus TaxID=39420 RepID=B5LWH9_9PHYC|nr:hypothetical protein FeldSpV_gp090 [Feldmannia species virus]ACH46842.1 unknown [Feldmannia species virus]
MNKNTTTPANQYVYDPSDVNVPQVDPSALTHQNKTYKGQNGLAYTSRMRADRSWVWVRERNLPGPPDPPTENSYPYTYPADPVYYYPPYMYDPSFPREEHHYYYEHLADKEGEKEVKPSKPKVSKPSKPIPEVTGGCNIYQEVNPATGRCRYKCADHQERSPATGRCRNPCASHQYRNQKTGQCRNL